MESGRIRKSATGSVRATAPNPARATQVRGQLQAASPQGDAGVCGECVGCGPAGGSIETCREEPEAVSAYVGPATDGWTNSVADSLCRMGNYIYTPEEGRLYSSELFRLAAEGKLKVQVHKEYPLSSAGVQQAQKDLTGGQSIGKLLIKVADGE